MADISTWSPVDESNNQPPPDGWPEGMAPSGVNNCARAMMGAVRRFYDQIIAGTCRCRTCRSTGGTVTGDIMPTAISMSVTTPNVAGMLDYRATVCHGGTSPAILAVDQWRSHAGGNIACRRHIHANLVNAPTVSRPVLHPSTSLMPTIVSPRLDRPGPATAISSVPVSGATQHRRHILVGTLQRYYSWTSTGTSRRRPS